MSACEHCGAANTFDHWSRCYVCHPERNQSAADERCHLHRANIFDRCTTTLTNRPVCAEDDSDYAPEVDDSDPMFTGVDWAAKGAEFKAFVERTIVELDEAKRDPAKAKCRKEPWL